MPLPIKRGSRLTVETETGTHLTPTQQSNIRIFRQVASELREALALQCASREGFKVINGYIESEEQVVRVRRLCVPVRRCYLVSDPINFHRILEIVKTSSRESIVTRAQSVERAWEPIREELDSASILNDRRVLHREMFEVWITAQVFPDVAEKTRPYQAMVEELGKAVEGIGLHLAERIAERILDLDEVVAEYAGPPRVADTPPES